MLDRLKLIGAAVLGLLVLVVVLQNTETVETKLLFASVTMPRAALLFGTLIIGFALGVVCTAWFVRAKKKKKSE